MPKKIERAFENEYMKKGYSKSDADRIFYSWENKNLSRELINHPKMSKEWREQEKKESGLNPFTPRWMEKEKSEGHQSLTGNKPRWSQWIKEESHERRHRR